ncbi:hypothetical protein G5B46_07710 [Caulobacter sp. 602-2]|uniref:Uncharacterized protein n=1 Tax=Caulobacter sp. 602-2 TaxID=2710887 RepID=A0A6G4QX25_9CAUL|nr:hypothetical protein [Caulobacter sp. 602-2]NGM49488.1 hypothetical protein [Caulobacter sp. 602-2]
MTGPDPRSFADYQRAATNLRGSLRRNQWDSRALLKDDVRIRYVFDTNVFLFHADLEDQSNQMEDLASLLGIDTHDPFLEAMERLTADYMFSGRLPGQRGEPAYLASQHFTEIVDRSYAIERRLSAVLPADPATRRRIRDILSSGGAAPADRLQELQRLIPKAWLRSLHTQTHFKEVLQTLQGDRPSVTPLHHVQWGWEAGRPLEIDVEDWVQALGQAQPNRDINRSQDARAIATMVDLYRNDVDALFDDRKTIYLFVTTDATILRAVASRITELRSEGIPYFVRTPRDFSPLLNIKSMGEVYARNRHANTRDLEGIFRKLSSALDWIEVGSSTASLDELQTAWRAFSENSTFLNAEYFEKSDRVLFKGLNEFISEHYETSVETLRTTLDQLRQKHVTVVLDSALAATIANRDPEGRTLSRRAQFKPIGRQVFDGLIGGHRTVGEFVDMVIAKRTLPEDTDARISNNPGQPNIAMLVACLFLAAEDWSAAADFAGQAVAKLDSKAPPALAAEACYLRALCLRFSMRSDREFAKARRQLERNIVAYRGKNGVEDKWRNLRDRIERATLYLSAVSMQAISRLGLEGRERPARGANYLPPELEREYFLVGMRESVTALSELEDNFSGSAVPGATMRELYLGLEIQAVTNLAGAWIFAAALPHLQAVPESDRADVLRRLRTIIDEAEAEKRPLRETQHIYALILRSLESGSETQRRMFGGLALQRITALIDLHKRMPINDRVRFTYLAEWLEPQEEPVSS